MILLYTQPDNFTSPDGLEPNAGVSTFVLSQYVSDANLTGPVAGMYFTVEVGTASASVSATSAVDTSTLPVPSSTSAGSSANSTSTSSARGKFEAAGSVAGVFAGLIAAFALA